MTIKVRVKEQKDMSGHHIFKNLQNRQKEVIKSDVMEIDKSKAVFEGGERFNNLKWSNKMMVSK